MKPTDGGLPLSLEYARREDCMLAPVTIPRSEAPVKQVIKRGDEANVYDLPVVRHHAMDPAPYIDMTPGERPGRRFLQYRFSTQHGEGTAQAWPAYVAKAQLANPPQERREKPGDAGGYCH